MKIRALVIIISGSIIAAVLLNYGYLAARKRVPKSLISPETMVATSTPNVLRIPSLNVIAPIQYVAQPKESVFQKALQNGVVHFPGTAFPGEPGNSYIFGHSSDDPWHAGNYKTIFAELPDLKIGMDIFVTNASGTKYRYRVTKAAIIGKKDLSVLDQQGNIHRLLTLQTSYPVGTSKQRYIAVAHQIPEEVRGFYWTAGTAQSSRAAELTEYARGNGLNSVVIDVQQDNGTILWPDETLMTTMRDAGLYRIARVAVMRNNALATSSPAIAIKTKRGGLWRDRTGNHWVDPAAPEAASFALDAGREAYRRGFDEIQYDYVRFPSDGDLRGIVYPVYDGLVEKREIMREFFTRVGGELKKDGIPISFDVFGITLWGNGDYNIGQMIMDILPSADFISPMTYPSHYPRGFQGFENPARHPYDVVRQTLDHGATLVSSISRGVFRPWIQDFDLGANYGAREVEEQIRAARDSGASGWLLWNARNVYTEASYFMK